MLDIKTFDPVRYSVVTQKNIREIVLLRGDGCKWRRCRFCDYHLDSASNKEENYKLNREQLLKVTGKYQKLEVINSGSFVDLDQNTIQLIMEVCKKKNIKKIHFESHWMHRNEVELFKEKFTNAGIEVKMKIGVETFDKLFRECYLDKGISADTPEEIAQYFDEVCLLQGIPGQTKQSMISDIEIGLQHFDRVCVNIMQENGMHIKPDSNVITKFINDVYPLYIDNERVDILMENTEFGVGGTADNV